MSLRINSLSCTAFQSPSCIFVLKLLFISFNSVLMSILTLPMGSPVRTWNSSTSPSASLPTYHWMSRKFWSPETDMPALDLGLAPFTPSEAQHQFFSTPDPGIGASPTRSLIVTVRDSISMWLSDHKLARHVRPVARCSQREHRWSAKSGVTVSTWFQCLVFCFSPERKQQDTVPLIVCCSCVNDWAGTRTIQSSFKSMLRQIGGTDTSPRRLSRLGHTRGVVCRRGWPLSHPPRATMDRWTKEAHKTWQAPGSRNPDCCTSAGRWRRRWKWRPRDGRTRLAGHPRDCTWKLHPGAQYARRASCNQDTARIQGASDCSNFRSERGSSNCRLMHYREAWCRNSARKSA